jgi:cell wall-associated NlpC family hydrolase
VTLRKTQHHRSRLKRVSSAMVAAVGGVLLAVSVGGTAGAAPTPAEIEAQIDQQWNQLEPVIEQYNAADSEYKVNAAKATQLGDQIRPLALQVDVALSRVSAISVQYYESGRANAFSAILTTGSATTFADQLMTLNGIAANEQAQIKDVMELKAKYDAQKKPLDELLAKLGKQKSDLAAKKADITNQITKLNQLRLAAYGSGAGTGDLRPAPCPSTYDGSLGSKAAQMACKQIGKPYIFNTAGPKTFDCSGLTMYAWAQVGVTYLRHYTQWQYSDTKRVTKDELRPGDLVFVYPDRHHMGMYVGGGWLVHAPHTGDVVRMVEMSKEPVSGYGRPKY